MLTFPSAPPPNELGISTNNSGATVSKLGSQGSEVSITANFWNHVTIVLVRPSSTSTFVQTITVTNSSGSMKDVEVDAGGAPSGDLEVRLGAFSTSAGAGFVRARFDHVVVRRW